jgi:hypothetical protein
MTTKTIDNGKVNDETVHKNQDETFVLVNNSQLNLTNNGGTATVQNGDKVSPSLGPIGHEVLVLESNHGDTRVGTGGANFSGGTLFGNFTIRNHSTLSLVGGTHTSWVNVGLSIIDNGSQVDITTNTSGGLFLVEHGSTIKIFGAVGNPGSTPVVLDHGGTLQVINTAFDVTFQTRTAQHLDELDMTQVFNAASFSFKDDLLLVFNSEGNQIGGTSRLHNLTGAPIQVDQTEHGVVVVADATPRPGMLPEHVA